MKQSSPQAGRLNLLDGMRGLAAFCVIVDHVPSEPLRFIFAGRYLAVDFFFALSGFVLARAYSDALTDWPGRLRFIKLRLIRFYPMYLLGFAIGLFWSLVSMLKGWSNTTPAFHLESGVAGLLFLPSPATLRIDGGSLFPYDGPAWSLFFELIINIFWALLAFRLRGRSMIFFLAATFLWAGLAVYHASEPGLGWTWTHFFVGLARVSFGFFVGVALYQVSANRSLLPKVPVWLALIPFMFLLTQPVLRDQRSIFDVIAMGLIIPLTILLAANSTVTGWSAKLCRWLGRVSYGVYIIHVPLFLVMLIGLEKLGLNPTIQTFIVAAVASVVTQIAIEFYEMPLRRLLTSRFVPKRAVSSQTDPA